MFVSPAFAQDGGGGLGGIEPLIPLVLIFVVFYFLLIRPQQKKAKAHRQMITELRRGDRIVTSGGLIGHIHRVIGDNELMIEIADGIRVRVMRAMVAEVSAKPEPRLGRDDDDDDDRGRRRNRSKARDEAADEAPDDDDGRDDRDDRDDQDDRGDEREDDDNRDDDRDQDNPRRSKS